MIIAIDGPGGSGKSSVAKAVAQRLAFGYLDTGAMYRAVACLALQEGIDPADEAGVSSIVFARQIEFGGADDGLSGSRVLIGGTDVTEGIRSPEVDDNVSVVAGMASVREAMVARQRLLAADRNVVVEGRDIGTVVFPDAAVKVFLTATAEERSRRRALQHQESGISSNTKSVREALSRRDGYDSTREHSPLAPAADAIVLDTTELDFDEVVERVCLLARERRA